MKQASFLKQIVSCRKLIPLLLFFILSNVSFAQTDSVTANNNKEETSVAALVDFVSIQKSDNTVDLKATFKAKLNGSLTKLPGLTIHFFSTSDSIEKDLGQKKTDRNGVAILNCKADELTVDKEGKLSFKLAFAGNKSIEEAEETVSFKRARLILVPVKGDSTLSVQLKVVALTTGTETPVPETDLGVFVKRLFNLLKLGEGKTDENGEAIVEIPANLPGDAKGNIILIARVDDNEQYGNLEASVIQPWGKPVSDEIKRMPRALWSTHPPLWMLITFIVLMTAVWGHYVVILYELFRLRKEHPKPTD